MAPKKSNEQDTQYTPALNKKARAKKEQQPLPITGILLTKIGSQNDIERKPVNINEIVSTLSTIDSNAYMLPHNRDPTCMIKLQHMLTTSFNYTLFMDISRLNWGQPRDNRTRIAMSFYIASETITDGLEALKTSLPFQSLLTKYRLNLTPHNLLQSDLKAVAFFSGKTPIHTWHKHLRNQFQLYINEYLKDPHAVNNIFGEDSDVPTDIPFYLKGTTLKSQTTKTTVIMIYVGKNHSSSMQTLLTKVPFPDVQLVLMSQKHQTPDIFVKQLHLHHTLCEKSRAIKLRNTSEDLCLALAHKIREDETVGEHIINVAEASSTLTEGTLYISSVWRIRNRMFKNMCKNSLKLTLTNTPMMQAPQ